MEGPTFDLRPFLVPTIPVGNVTPTEVPAPTFEGLCVKIAETRLMFADLSRSCQYRTLTNIGSVNPKQIDICEHDEFDITRSPSCMCMMENCPRI